jgi:hypothetical protein
MKLAAALALGLVLGAAAAFFARPRPLCLDLVYRDALVNAGSTDYVFERSPAVGLWLRVEHATDDAAAFAGLTVPGSDGPAEPDPARLGRPYAVCFTDPLQLRPAH